MGVPISNVTRRVVYEASGTGPYSFTFEILANTDISVYKDDELLTLTTDYTVTINSNGTGYITLVASPTGADQIAIVGDRAIQRTSDFVTGGDFFANTVNAELDSQTIFAQQNAEAIDRALKAPQTDPTTIDMTLPRASVRAGKVLAFDSNGDPTTGEVIGDFRGEWASGTAYNKRDIVKDPDNANIYYCTVAHTSSGSAPISGNTDSGKWTLIVDAESASDAQDAAEAAQAAAETAETNAETAETNAETAATAAASSASAASTSASSAATSATNAASSATTASTKASEASTSASNAATSATSASSSASSANSSASSASSSASSASTSASNASTSATNAASSASSASTSASTATTQATNASNSATAAATSATNASNSATAAATSATNAAASETAAAASAAAAASSLDSFDDRYLGAKSSDPTVDNDGNALVTGALYYSTTAQAMKVYDGAAWITATAAGTTAMSRYRFVATAGQTTFTGADANSLTLSYTSGNIVVARNGAMLDTSEYTATNGTSIVLSVAAALNDVVDIVAFKSFTVADTYTKGEVDGFTVKLTGTQTVAGSKTFSSDVTVQKSGASDNAYFRAKNADREYAFGARGSVNDNFEIYDITADLSRFAIDSSGNVGIGTSSPVRKLNISGSGVFGASTGATVRLDNTTSGRPGIIDFDDSQNLNVWANTDTGSIRFFTATGAGTERARIDSSGNLLVGLSTSVAGKLQVKNNSGDAASGIAVVESGTNNYWSQYMYTVTHDLYLAYNNTNKGYFQSSGGSYVAVSDQRLKKDIADIQYGLAAVLALRPTSYLMNEDDEASKKHLGFIAQEAQEVIPEVVFDMQGGMLGMDKSAIIPVLVKAIQEQQAIIEQLRADVEALKNA